MLTIAVLLGVVGLATSVNAAPEQAHLALTRSVDELRLVWVSQTKGGVPTIRYKQPGAAERTVTGTSTTYTIDQLCAAPANEAANFEDPGQINVATMTGLAPGEPVWFEYGTSADGFANSSAVVGLKPGATSANIVVLADMGRASASTDQLLHEVDNTTVVLFPGDLSYAMGRKGLWADWFRMVEPVFSRVPMQTGCGNHDVLQLQGDERFWPSWGSYELDTGTKGECGVPFQHLVAMDGEDDEGRRAVNNNWTSLDLDGVAHVVTLSTEHNFTAGSRQARWLLRDLASVNRSRTPWLVVQFHRPMYDSTFNALLPEEGATRAILEPVLEAAGADLVLTAHIHDYQSMHCRVYNGTCRTGPAPVGRPVMMIGGGGKTSGVRAWMDSPEWLAARTNDLGYARFQPRNGTAALWQWVRNSNGTVFDTHWIERPVVGAAAAARAAGEADAPGPHASAAALEQWRRRRVAAWMRGPADVEGRADSGVTDARAADAAIRGARLASEAGHVIDPEALFAAWGV